MKKIALYIGIAIAAIGCAKDNIGEATPSSGAIEFSATVESDETRLSESDDCAWSEGDAIGIFTNNSSDAYNMKFIVSDVGNGTMTSEVSLYASEQRTYYAYYPHSSDHDATSEISIDCTKSQVNPLLWATSVDATTASTAVELGFKHLFSKVTFSLTVGGVDATLLGDNPAATLTGANAKANFVITGDGSFSSVSTGDISLTISSGKITAYLLPGDYTTGGVTLWITADDTLNNTFYYPINEEWESGKSYAYTVTVGEKLTATE